MNAITEGPNALILCACGCGETLARLDFWGRARRYKQGHNARQTQSGLTEIVDYLSDHGPTKRGDIAAALGRKAANLDKSLWLLRDRGLVTSPKHGVWAAVDQPEPRPLARPAELVELAEVAALWSLGRATDEQLHSAAQRVVESEGS